MPVPASRPVSVRLLVCAEQMGDIGVLPTVFRQRAQLAEPERMEAKSVEAYAQGREGLKAPRDWVISD